MVKANVQNLIALMPPNDLPDQESPLAETTVSGRLELLTNAQRRLISWAQAHRLPAALALGGGVILIIVLVLVWVVIPAKKEPAPQELVTIDQVLDALDRRAFAETQVLAKRLEKQDSITIGELGGPAFALGATAAYEAEDAQGKDRVKLYLLAARYLDEAYNRGLPANRNPEGLFLLGKSLYETGQIAASRSVLLSAMKTPSPYRMKIHALLADIYLRESSPQLEQALQQNSLYMGEKKLSDEERQEGLLQRAQILLRMGKIEQCNAALDQIPPDSKYHFAAVVARGQVLIYEAHLPLIKIPVTAEDQALAREKLQHAMKTLRLVQGKEVALSKVEREAWYLIGLCLEELGDYKAALNQFIHTHNTYPETPEGSAASFHAAEIYRHLGRDLEALSEYRRALNEILSIEGYRNPLIAPEQMKSRLLAAYQQYLGAEKFEITLQLTRLMRPLCPADQELLLEAEAYGVWGRTLLNQADKAPRVKAESIRALGREQLRRAGICYAKLAKLLPANRTYTDQVWNSALAYFQGQDFQNAARMFQIYLKNEVQLRRAQALTYLGESLLALNELDKALEMFKECMELHGRDIAACRARYLAARAYWEKGDNGRAETMLLENLNNDYLTPAGKEWRDSLFALGDLLYAEGRWTEAARRLEEAVKRYPDDPEAVEARYLTADCYRQMTLSAGRKNANHPTDNPRLTELKPISELLSLALQQYKQVQEILSSENENAELNAAQAAMLRNCYFGIGELLLAQGKFAEALKAYSIAANRYQNRPEGLDAYVQVANLYRRLNKPQEAQLALQQAKFALTRMKTDVVFENTSNFNHKQWADRLDRLSKL